MTVLELHHRIIVLVQEAQKGREDALAALMDLTQERLFKFCLMLGHKKEMAEDLCQETYIKAFRNLDKLKSPGAFVGWLYQIAKNLFIDMKRSPSSQEDACEDVVDEKLDPSLEVILNVKKVLSQFDPEERLLLLLIELEGYSYKEAGDIVGSSEDAVRSKLHRLRGAFIKKYNSGETN